MERLKAVIYEKKYRFLFDFGIITLVGIVIFRNFLFTTEWPAGGDVLGMISRSYLFGKDFRWLYVWRSYSFGFVEGVYSWDFLLMLINIVCGNPVATVKIFLFFSFLAAGFTMYAFAYRYTRNRIAAVFASLVYVLNQWFLSQFTEAHGDIILGYALAPLLFLLLDRALERGKIRDILVLALMFSIFITGFHPECTVIYGFFLLLFVAFYILFPAKSSSFSARIRRLIKISLPLGITVFLLSAFSLIPFLLNVKPYYYSSAFKYPMEYIYTYNTVVDAFMLWSTETWGYFKVFNIFNGLSLLGFPTTVLLLGIFYLAYCTIFLRRERYTMFFAVSAFISIFLSMGDQPPFGDIFLWMWFNIPHFAIFRAASRWVMMACFSHAFFISVLVGIIVNCIKRKDFIETNEAALSLKTRLSKKRDFTKEISLTLNILNNFSRRMYKFLYYLGMAALLLIVLSVFFSCFFFFSYGLQVYTPPQIYIEPYEWISNQPEDFKIVTVSKDAVEWIEGDKAHSDFCCSAMLTDIGWGHDIGFDSSFIHDKPVLQNGGWEPFPHAFVDHLRFRLVYDHMTDDLLKILGTLNFKYIVLPPYASANMRDFFLNQQGVNIVYNKSDSVIIENTYYTPRLFAATEHAIVLGGLESFSSLCKIDSFNLTQTALLFPHQTSTPFPLTPTTLNRSKAIILVNSDILDIVMLSLKNDANLIIAAQYGVPSQNVSKYWTGQSFWRHIGGFTLGGNTLTTLGKNTVDIPFTVDSDGTYDIWLRVGFAPARGNLQIYIDGDFKGEFRPESSYWSGLKWINVTRLNLRSNSNHKITLKNDGTGFNDVDAIAIVKSSIFQSKFNEVLNALQNFSGRLVYLLEAENIFTYNASVGWSVSLKPYTGLALSTTGTYLNIAPLGNVTASSIESEGLEPQKAVDENLSTRWASAIGIPQWLKIEWDTPQKLQGIHVIFENAYAEDYVIQTWNGTAWVNQTSVKGNNLLERYHNFPHFVTTTKLRICMTATRKDLDMVSIWELECYSTETTSASAKFFVPKEGKYMIAAHLFSSLDHGMFYVKVGDATFSVSCRNESESFGWYEFGSVSLEAGEQTIRIDAIGKVDVDSILVHLLKDGEDNLTLNDLFKTNVVSPSISYEKINPCKYVIHVKCTEPFQLVFSESYHPLWKAYVNNTEIPSTVAYFLANSFFINKTGEFDVLVYFTGQTYADVGLKISLVTFICIMVFLLIPPSLLRLLKECVLHKKFLRRV